MIASFEWFVLEFYYLYYNNSSYSETSCYSVFYNTHPPPPQKKTEQIKDPLQGNFASKIGLIWW